MKGVVKKLIMEKGFGFILGEDRREYFFHRSAVRSPLVFEKLSNGDSVFFQNGESPKGLRAEDVRMVG